MKRSGPPRRKTRLRSNAATQREWERRTRERRLTDPVHADAARRAIGRAAAESKDLRDARLAVQRRSGGWCEAGTPACLPGRHAGCHAHHMQLRSQGGADTDDNLLWICAPGHKWVHDHPETARERGWIRSAWAS